MIDIKTNAHKDISTEADLRIKSLLSEKILAAVPITIFVLDIRTEQIIYSNFTSKEFLSYSFNDQQNNALEIGKLLLSDTDYEWVVAAFNELNHCNDDRIKTIELRLKDKDGNYYWFEVKLTVFTRDINNNSQQIIGLLQNIDEKRKTAASLVESDLSYKNLFNTIEDAIYIQDETFKFIDVNNGAELIDGFLKDELIGKTPEFLSAPGKNDYEKIKEKLTEAFIGIPQQFEFWVTNKDGAISLKDVKVYNGIYFGKKVIVAHVQDITKRKREEEKMHSALAEKNVLLREVHHRVKNNLQAMIYLIEMQIDRLDDEKVKIFLRELQEQARTMSLVYEQLYQSDYLAKVDMDGYLNNLTSNVIQAFGLNKDINFYVNANNVSLDVETAMPCGLIINELLTNSLKYAFPDGFGDNPTINILLTFDNNKITITTSDNGIGFPDNFDWENTDSLGLKLVNFWVKYQLAGSIKLDTQGGTNFIICFEYED